MQEIKFLGIKDNAVIFKCGSETCGEEGQITKDGESNGHDTYHWIKKHVGRILSENNFENYEFSEKEWENYEKSLIEKTDEEQQNGVEGEKSDFFIPLFIYMNFRRRKNDELEIIPDEIPEDVKNYLLNSSIFEGNEELYNDAIIGKGENK